MLPSVGSILSGMLLTSVAELSRFTRRAGMGRILSRPRFGWLGLLPRGNAREIQPDAGRPSLAQSFDGLQDLLLEIDRRDTCKRLDRGGEQLDEDSHRCLVLADLRRQI